MRPSYTYRGAWRNIWHGNWSGVADRAIEALPVRPNKRDRAAKRPEHITVDFTDGVAGISRALRSFAAPTLHQKKPKRGWAAARRKAPFCDALGTLGMERARMRHAWYRRKKAWDALRRMLAAE